MHISQPELPNRAGGELQIVAEAACLCFYTVKSSAVSLRK